MSTVVAENGSSNRSQAIGLSRPQTGFFIREPLADQTVLSSDDDDQTPLAWTFPTQSNLTIRGTPLVGESSNGMSFDLAYFTA
jgi:hypothetical protein